MWDGREGGGGIISHNNTNHVSYLQTLRIPNKFIINNCLNRYGSTNGFHTHTVPVRIGVEGSGRGSVHHATHIMNGNNASHAVHVMYTIHISRGMRDTGAHHVYV